MVTERAARDATHEDLLDALARELALRDPDGSRTAGLVDATTLVEQAVARLLGTSLAWAEQLGPVYDAHGVQSILGVTKQAVSKRRLLALTTGSGRVVYPAFQFTSSGVVPGLADLLAVLDESLVSPWTVASWLASPAVELDGARPIDVLADGDRAPVLVAARAWAGDALRLMQIDVARLPLHALDTGARAFRIYRRFGPDAAPRGPWYFSSAGSATSGRFDLPHPRGTCYFASTAVGAWLEVFGGTRLVDAADVRRRALATAVRSGGPLSLVDLASRRAAAAGVSLDLSATDDYARPQQVACDADARGAAGLRALLRRDPSGASHNLALFGHSGAPSRQFGWRVTRAAPWQASALLHALADIGIRAAEIPHDLPISTPPAATAHPAKDARGHVER